MQRWIKGLIRAGAFLGKEIAEVRRQPRLVLSLILGPFLILLLFGVGYQGEKGNLAAGVVVPTTEGYSKDPAEYRKLAGDQMDVAFVTTDQNVAIDRLRRQDVDIVVVVPADASAQIAKGAQAIMPVYFNEVDPLRRDYITYLTYLYTNEINKQTLAAAASKGQQSAGDMRSAIQRMRNSLAAVEQRMDAGDEAGASTQAHNVQGSSLGLGLGVVLLGQLLSTNTTVLKAPPDRSPEQVSLEKSQAVTSRLNADAQQLNDELSSPNPDRARVRTSVGKVRTDLDEMDQLTAQFQSINPLVLAAPFYAKVENKAPITASFTSFYAPGVLVLLLQHIAVTLAALSMVRERLLGTVELFQVSPVRPGEILGGKYASFMIFLGFVSALLLLLMSNNTVVSGIPLSLGVPILGDYGLLAISIALVIFASIGLGFLIATVSKSESQAVQISMLVLLTSVFFSGFFLRLETLWEPIRYLAYLLPVTSGITSLQVIMLRGGTPASYLLVGLLLLGVFYGAIGFFRFSRELRRG